MSRALCCEVCDSVGAAWRIERRGDAMVTWACDEDLSAVCVNAQRDFEATQLIVVRTEPFLAGLLGEGRHG